MFRFIKGAMHGAIVVPVALHAGFAAGVGLWAVPFIFSCEVWNDWMGGIGLMGSGLDS